MPGQALNSTVFSTQIAYIDARKGQQMCVRLKGTNTL